MSDHWIKCRVCKQNFTIPSWYDYVFKISNDRGGYHYFCSWHCLRAWEKTHDNKKRYNTIK